MDRAATVTSSPSLARHPCFDEAAGARYGRIHVPVAPACNIQCNYCNRKYHCVNERRPGVTKTVMTPAQALDHVLKARGVDPRIAVVGIAGPGDAFANPDETLETLTLLRRREPELIFCVATNGLRLCRYVDDLKRLRVSHVTITVNAVDPSVGARIYHHVLDEGRMIRGEEAARMLCSEQLAAIRKIKERAIICKVNTVVVPGINDHHVPEVARAVSALGVDTMNCIPFLPIENTAFSHVPEPSSVELDEVRRRAAELMPQMTHCRRCRADAVGLLGEDGPAGVDPGDAPAAPERNVEGAARRSYVAVASADGIHVDQHLGMARKLQIWRQDEAGFALVGVRDMPLAQGGDRWKLLRSAIGDCRALLVSGIGPWPRAEIAAGGTAVLVVDGTIESGLRRVYSAEERRIEAAAPPNTDCACDSGCSGDRTGCS
jgi:nitrogen fixation protein NifB